MQQLETLSSWCPVNILRFTNSYQILQDLTRSYSMLQHPPHPTTMVWHCEFKVASKDSTRKHVNSPEPSAQWFHCIPSAPTPTSGACLDLNISELSLFLHGGSYILAFALPCVAAGIKIKGKQWSNHLPKGICARILKIKCTRKSTIVDAMTQWLSMNKDLVQSCSASITRKLYESTMVSTCVNHLLAC